MNEMHPLFSLKGKGSMITGAARGIGLGMAKALAGAGSELILIDALEKELHEAAVESFRETGKRPLTITGNLGEMDDIKRMVREVHEHHPRIDCLINNAGTTVHKPFVEITPEDIAGSVIFQASAASDYITGQVLIVDGGWISA